MRHSFSFLQNLTNGSLYHFFGKGYILLFPFLFLFTGISNLAIAQELPCEGFSDKVNRVLYQYDNFRVIEKGKYYCGIFMNGRITFIDSKNKTLCILSIKKGIYQGELNPKTGEPVKKKKGILNEDGEFKDGVLYNGKKYIYDEKGLLIAIALFKDGVFTGLGKLE